ncbi:MAG: menaquinone biosynthesis protein [Peptococcaceae bacterium]|nr:menaquinone biosynthesis protein [Peptococcaceae bacterium]
MSRMRLGQVDYINCLPVYHALEEGLIPLEVELVKGPPTRLNSLFLSGELETTPLSSIEYARHTGCCYILPGLSISADGRVASILFFSKIPVTELDGKKVCLSESSATSVALLKVLFDHYYQVEVEFETAPPDLDTMMEKADGALLIGDDAMLAHQRVIEAGLPYHVTDLGEAWKQFTGEKMVYAVWVVRKDCADSCPEKVDLLVNTLLEAKKIGLGQPAALIAKAQKRTGLPLPVLEDYFETIRHDFDEDYRRALLTFYDYAYKSGLIDERVKLRIWGELDE